MDLISIVIPAYNVEKYLDECLQSVINQTYGHLEIIIVDDGSTDSTPQICDEFALKDDRITVIHKENGGLSSARNAGVVIATGEYITFIDSDDYVTFDYVEQLYHTLKKDNADISILSSTVNSDYLHVGIVEESKKLTATSAVEEMLKEKSIHTSSCGKLYRKDFFSDVRFPEGRIYEDYATTYLLFEKASLISIIPVKKYYYRDNFLGITKSSFSEKNMQYFEIASTVDEYICKKYPKLYKYAIARDVNMALGFYRKICYSNYHNSKIEKELVGYIRNGLRKYLISGYPISKKIVSIVVAISPRVSKVFLKRT